MRVSICIDFFLYTHLRILDNASGKTAHSVSKAERPAAYRKYDATASRKYSTSVPFTMLSYDIIEPIF